MGVKVKKSVSTTASKKKSRFELQLETLRGCSRSRITVKEKAESKPFKAVIIHSVSNVIKRKKVEQNDDNNGKPKKKNKIVKVLKEKQEEIDEEQKEEEQEDEEQEDEEQEEEKPKKKKQESISKYKEGNKKKPMLPHKEKVKQQEQVEEQEKEEEKPKKNLESFPRYELNGINQIIDQKNQSLRTEVNVTPGAKKLFVKMVKHCVKTLDDSFNSLNQKKKLITAQQAEKEIEKLYPSSLLTALGEMKVKKNYEPVFGVERWPTLNREAQSLVCSALDKFFKFFFSQAAKNTRRYRGDYIEDKNVKYLVGESSSLSKMFPELNTYTGMRRVQEQDNIWEWQKCNSVDVTKI